MAASKSIKMYLTIFVATTCVYMVLYQYNFSRQPMTQAEYAKSKASISANADDTNARKYNSILWSPMSLFSARQPQEQALIQQSQLQLQQTSQKQQQQQQSKQSISDRQSSAPPSNTIEQRITNKSAAAAEVESLPLSSPLHNLSLSSSGSSNSSASKSSSKSNSSIPTNTTINTNNNAVVVESLNRTATAMEIEAMNADRNSLVGSVAHSTTSKTASSTTTYAASRLTTTTTTRTSHVSSLLNTDVPLCRTVDGRLVNGTNPLPAPPPPLYIITPTYKRAEQLAELTRLGYTLKHIPNLLWLVIEDANQTSPLVVRTLNRIGVPYEYFLAPMPDQYKRTKKAKPRGVSNRNRGLDYIRANATEGVLYFADDDNTYDISIFEQMRYTKKVSMWPVGLVTKFGLSTPIIRDGKVVGFYDGWIGGRKFPVDMAGFAVSVRFLHQRPNARMPFKPGYEEDGFLRSLAPLNLTEIELLASNCTEILTWHTQTKKNANASAINLKTHGNTNLVVLDKFLVRV